MSGNAQAATSTTPPKRRGRWRRRLLKLFLFLLVLVAVLPFALRLGFVRDAIADALATRLGKPVRIGAIEGWYAQGFTIRDFVVESGPGFEGPLLTVPEAHAELAWMRLLGGRPDVTARLTKPELVILVDEAGKTNLEGFLPATEKEPRTATRRAGPGPDVRLIVEDATVRVPDPSRVTLFTPIRLDVAMRNGQVAGEASVVVPRGGPGGDDVTLLATLPTADDKGPQVARVSTSGPIDVIALRALLERVAGVEVSGGRVEVDLQATIDGGAITKASGGAKAVDLFLDDHAGGSFRAGLIDLVVDVPEKDQGSLQATFGELRVTRPREDGPPLTFSEPEVKAVARWVRTKDGATRVEVASLEAGASAEAKLAEPFVLPAEGESWSQGRLRARADLARLAPLLGAFEGLDRLRGGALLVEAVAESGPDGSTALRIGAALDQVTLAPGPEGRPGAREPRLEAQLRWRRAEDEDRVEIVQITCSSLRTSAGMRDDPVVIVRTPDHTRATGTLEADVDLGAASTWLRALGALPPTDDIGGQAKLEVAVDADRRTGRLRGQVVGRDVRWRTSPSDPGWVESAPTFAFDVSLPSAEAPGRAHQLTLRSSGLELEASGATWRSEPESEIDATLSLGGDAGRLAGLVKRLLGAGYEDLVANGPVDGRIAVRGVPGDGGRLILVDGNVRLGTWRTQGLTLEQVQVRATRERPSDPLATEVQARANGGTLAARVGVDLGREDKPWTFEADLAGVDTSPLVTNRGAGRYLAYAVPALLPADAATPALSGRLDAQVRLEADALDAPKRDDTLRGTASVRLVEGEIRNSTLFRGEKMGSALQAIAVAVPDAGKALQGVARALLFTSVDSRLAIGARRVEVQQLDLMGRHAKIHGRGQVGFDERLAMDVDLVLEGKLLARVAKEGSLPLQVRGTLGQPQVLPRIDVASLVGGSLGKEAVDRLKDLLGK
ncbi:MAG: AsmA-like C-terminal region-containing protein [Planctomycetota bacterium]